jgi:hypothetical protein
MVLYRPTGANELALIAASHYKSFLPRLPEQPIFYPVVTEQYAIEIASKWNAVDGKKGYVARFEVDDDYIADFREETVGAEHHREYWIPAEDLPEFYSHIIGPIEIIHEFGESND